jgi:hypothetical protein
MSPPNGSFPGGRRHGCSSVKKAHSIRRCNGAVYVPKPALDGRREPRHRPSLEDTARHCSPRWWGFYEAEPRSTTVYWASQGP